MSHLVGSYVHSSQVLCKSCQSNDNTENFASLCKNFKKKKSITVCQIGWQLIKQETLQYKCKAPITMATRSHVYTGHKHSCHKVQPLKNITSPLTNY